MLKPIALVFISGFFIATAVPGLANEAKQDIHNNKATIAQDKAQLRADVKKRDEDLREPERPQKAGDKLRVCRNTN